jgi:hypothetical protein
MMSLMMWACLVLLPATLHSVSGMLWCRCVTRPVAVLDRWSTVLALCCNRTIATYLTVLPAQSY